MTTYSWWVDRFGNNVTYWDGEKSVSATGCQCGEDGSCDTGHGGDGNNICNCDARDNVNVDYGVLTSRDQLPVMELAYGDSQYRYSWIHYTLGRFTCEGKRWIYPSEIHDNDFAVKVGFTSVRDGYYDYLVSGYNIYFGQTIYDRSLGSWKDDRFTAPVDGFYSFHLNMHTFTTNSYPYFYIGLYKDTESGTVLGKTLLRIILII